MTQGIVELGAALDLHPVGALVQRRDDDAGVIELALDHAELVRFFQTVPTAPAVVVDDGHEVVADVPLLLGALGVAVPVGHHGGHVEHHLHHVVLPQVGEVAVAVVGTQSAQKRHAAVVSQRNQRSQPLQELGVPQRPELIGQDHFLLVRLAVTHVNHPHLVRLVSEIQN